MDLSQLQRQPAPLVGQLAGQRGRQKRAPAASTLARRTLAHGIEDEDTRYPGMGNDGKIRRGNTPFTTAQYRHGAGTGMVDWTACGPVRPELHVRQEFALRTMAGTSHTRYLASPADPRNGLHSTPPRSAEGNSQRIAAGQATIRPGRQNRLTTARYTGQSYSQTTRVQGGS